MERQSDSFYKKSFLGNITWTYLNATWEVFLHCQYLKICSKKAGKPAQEDEIAFK